MVDSLAPRERSERMKRIRGKNTGPEMVVRRLIHGMDIAIAFTAMICPADRILPLEISGKLYSCIDVSGIVTLIRIAN